MKQVGTLLLIAIFSVLLVANCGCAAIPKYPIDYVMSHSVDLGNTQVTIEGSASNPTVLPPDPDPKEPKWQYDLTDKAKNVIVVKTTQKPPAAGEWIQATGMVINADGTAYLLVTKRGGILDMWRYIVLGVLVILAIVLVVLLLRKPQEEDASPEPSIAQPIASPTSRPPFANSNPAIAVAKECPQCGKRYHEADASMCEDCGVDLRPASPTISRPVSSGPTMVPETPRSRREERPTAEMPAVSDAALAELVVVEGNGARRGTEFRLIRGQQKIGRAEGVDIRLLDDTISREHATVWSDDGIFFIQDQFSKSGTMVNGQKVTRQSLTDNDEIQLGTTKMVFRQVRN